MLFCSIGWLPIHCYCRLHHSECQCWTMAQYPSLSSGMSPHSLEPRWEPWPRLGPSWFPTLLAVVTGSGPQIGLARPGQAMGFPRVILTPQKQQRRCLAAPGYRVVRMGLQSEVATIWGEGWIFGSSHLNVWAALYPSSKSHFSVI